MSSYSETSRPFGRHAQPTSLEITRLLPVEVAVRRTLFALSNLGRLTTRAISAVGNLRATWSSAGRL